MHLISSLLHCDREYENFLSSLSEGLTLPKPLPIVVNGLSGGAVSAFAEQTVLAARKNSRAPVLLLVGSEEEAEAFTSRLCRAGLQARTFPRRDFVLHTMSASHDTERERLSVLSDLLCDRLDAVVTTAGSAASLTMPRDRLRALSLDVRVGDSLPLSDLAKRLSALGFARVDTVESTGQFALRGGIADFWSAGLEAPVRLEFFGDDIDRMSYFDPISQRMTGDCDGVSLLPAEEILPNDEAKTRIRAALSALQKKCKDPVVAEELSLERTSLDTGLTLPAADKFLPLIYPEEQTLFSYFDIYKRAVVLLFGTSAVKEQLLGVLKLAKAQTDDAAARGALLPDTHLLWDEKQVADFFARNLPVHVNPFAGGVGTVKEGGLFGFRCRRTVSYGDAATLLHEDLASFRKGNYRVLLVSETEAGAKSLHDSLSDADIPTILISKRDDFDYTSLQYGGIYITAGDVDEGFELLMPKIAVLSMKRDSGRVLAAERRQKRVLKRVGGAGERLMSYADLSVGDYVVHRNYGIGRFEGIQTVRVDGVKRDYITLQYAGTDKLFIPCDRLEMIGKYIGAHEKDGTVKLSKMGSSEWSKATGRAKKAVKDIAKDLIQLYAERQRTKGFAFPPADAMENEFADRFEFEETDAQAAAIDDILHDMMRPVPMNRLLCGDVGFGKTEVALRAVFKAVLAGKQVAILVPTTILALQHYQTCLSRMRGYAVNIEMLSRFRTPKEQANILRRVKRGEIDLLIGTHKLLSKDLAFRDLGLLIVDEEQRFGVVQKEKLKTLSVGVDVLTLTATPIPRTLHMAMNGISDMSVLDEAPTDRRPVQTYVLEYDEAVVYDAIRKELFRGGQVLYLYNKIEDIDLVAGRLMKAFPDARITYAHGQMEHDELEDIWQALVRGEMDILVCTTIVETGIDLPNANTLIIEGADRMGLSQMHQLRGRVGRSSRQAYAYFTYRAGKSLSEVAQKRLEVIREFAEFGAGFKVALRDLEIRGAGNLLGAEQHGYIESVGYDLYVKLLSEAVLEEKGELPPPPFESTVDIPVDAHIPPDYIATSAARMEMYKKISLIQNEDDVRDVIDEFLDRFGNLPPATERLVRISFIRASAAKAKIRKVDLSSGVLSFRMEKPDLSVWSELFLAFPGLTFRTSETSPAAVYRLKKGEDAVQLAARMMQMYVSLLPAETETNRYFSSEPKGDTPS